MKKRLLKKELLKTVEDQISSEKLEDSECICPECGKNFKKIKVDEVELDYCIYCNSIWFDSGELSFLTGIYQDIPSQGLKLRSRKSKLLCPECKIQMEEHIFERGHNLLVDVCSEHGVYLQSGELARALEIV